jgi:hypothetical protein
MWRVPRSPGILALVLVVLAVAGISLVAVIRLAPSTRASLSCGPGVPSNNSNASGVECVSGRPFKFTTIPIPIGPGSNSTAHFGNVTFSFSWGPSTPAGRALAVNGTLNGVTNLVWLNDGPTGTTDYNPVLSPGALWGVQWGSPSAVGLRLLVL